MGTIHVLSLLQLLTLTVIVAPLMVGKTRQKVWEMGLNLCFLVDCCRKIGGIA